MILNGNYYLLSEEGRTETDNSYLRENSPWFLPTLCLYTSLALQAEVTLTT